MSDMMQDKKLSRSLTVRFAPYDRQTARTLQGNQRKAVIEMLPKAVMEAEQTQWRRKHQDLDARNKSLNAQLVGAKNELRSLQKEMKGKDDEIEQVRQRNEEFRQRNEILEDALHDVCTASKVKIEQEVMRANDVKLAVDNECLAYNQRLKDIDARLDLIRSPNPQGRVAAKARSEDNMEVDQNEKNCSIM